MNDSKKEIMANNYNSTWPLPNGFKYELISNGDIKLYVLTCEVPDHYITQSQTDFCDICGGKIPSNQTEYGIKKAPPKQG